MTRPEPPQRPGDAPDLPDRARRRDAANARARAMERAARDVLRDEGTITRHTPHGEVVITSVDIVSADGVDHIEARTPVDTETGETHFRIFNPPIGVRQSDGSVVTDPIGALVEVLAQHGGAQRGRKGRAR